MPPGTGTVPTGPGKAESNGRTGAWEQRPNWSDGSNGRTRATGVRGGLEPRARDDRRAEGVSEITRWRDPYNSLGPGISRTVLGETRSVQAYGRGNCPIFNHLPARFT
jgi:hypothetical protein